MKVSYFVCILTSLVLGPCTLDVLLLHSIAGSVLVYFSSASLQLCTVLMCILYSPWNGEQVTTLLKAALAKLTGSNSLQFCTVLLWIFHRPWTREQVTTLLYAVLKKLTGSQAAYIYVCSPVILAVELVLAGKQLTHVGIQTTVHAGLVATTNKGP